MSLKVVGVTGVDGYATTATIPTGTQAGDLLVLAITAGSTTTSRLTSLGDGVNYGIYYGISDGDLTPIPITHPSGGTGFHFLTDSHSLVTYGGVISVDATAQQAPVGGINPAIPPAPAGSHLAAVVALVSSVGTVAGGINADSTGRWTSDAYQWPDKWSLRISSWTAGEVADPIPPGSFAIDGTDPQWAAATLGLRVTATPATRQFPRDDGAGLSAGPRIHPPPRSRRTVGGYQ